VSTENSIYSIENLSYAERFPAFSNAHIAPDKFNFTQDEMNRKWDWTNMKENEGGVTCGSGLSYQHIRWLKSFIWAMGLDQSIYDRN
jgi:hypothetical protein